MVVVLLWLGLALMVIDLPRDYEENSISRGGVTLLVSHSSSSTDSNNDSSSSVIDNSCSTSI